MARHARSSSPLLRLLAEAESSPPDQTPLLRLDGEGRDVLIISDLHVGSGMNPGGIFGGTENFFADAALARLLKHVRARVAQKGNRSGLLVINGDFVDFLRIVLVPETDDDFLRWDEALRSVGIVDPPAEDLRDAINDTEKEVGLKTHDFKSIWKLDAAIHGHPDLFAALAAWIQAGNKVLITKGNHDLEWYWRSVRDYLRLALARKLNILTPGKGLNSCLAVVIRALQFVDDACVIDGQIYIEHGHRFDKFSTVVGGPVLGKNDKELNIPFGSFFNRYLVNKLELVYPFMDNVRPRQNILHILMRERFFLGLKVLVSYVPFTLKMIPKRYARFLLKPLLGYVLALGVPIALVVILWGDRLSSLFAGAPSPEPPAFWGLVIRYGTGVLKDAGVLFLGYLLSRLVAWFQLAEPDDLVGPAERKLNEHPECSLVTFGHTHNPEQIRDGDRWYINSGTWIPIIESSSATLREDKTYSLILLERGPSGRFIIRPLQRWNDDAGRIEDLVLVERK
jgi:UDP-2,3-diacylglucosamine pyrophosphatase LpxH